MRKTIVAVIAAGMMAASGGAVLSSDAFGVPQKTCDTGSSFWTGTSLGGTQNFNLVVPSGALCNIQGATVNGNIKVQPGGGLIIGSGSTVNGNVASYQAGSFPGDPCTGDTSNPFAFSVALGTNNTFNGTVSIKQSQADVLAGGSTGCGSETIKLQLFVEDNQATVVVKGNSVGGNAYINNNQPGPTIIFNNTVKGNLYCSGNYGLFSGNNSAAHIYGTDC